MSEPAEVCLVRCPECESLIPELTDFSVYRCRGCGAVLRVNDRNVEADEESVGGFSEKISDKSEKNDVRSNTRLSSRAENEEVLSDIAEKYRNGSKIKTDKWVVDNDLDMNKNLDDLRYAEKGKQFEQLKPQNEIANESRRLGQNSDWRISERGEMEGFGRNPSIQVEGVRDLTSNYSEEGPSNYHFGSSYGYRESVKNQNEADGFNKVELLEQDRAELLRKLHELEDQLSRSRNINDKTKEKVPLVRRMAQQDPYGGGSETWFPDGSLGSSRTSVQYSMSDRHVARPPYISSYSEPSPFSNRHEMALRSFYPSMHTSNQVQGIEDPVRSQMLRRAPHQAPGPLQPSPHHPYYSGHYIDNDMDPFESYPHNINLHPPSCSCFHCYSRHRYFSAPVPPTALYNKMFPDVPNNPIFYCHENPVAFGPQDNNTRIAKTPPLNSHNPQSHTRWPSDLNSESGGLVPHHTSRVLLATGGRRCRPIAGGAPFVTCFNCFELLQVPKKVLLMEKNQNKIQCGACSTVILFSVVNKKLVSVHEETKRTPTEVDDGSAVAVNGVASHSHGHCKSG
ncbi:hypothetical protein F0562_019328 [Nyssa sinensis]|uniref:Uncharacterized protein n=1 Tax=Nyssa sinensis TaxID=561372 RepID=A0A5J4ZDX2_9ASTE|nr:hypothetical protein F0562_019328 [Nyssa sinensis]